MNLCCRNGRCQSRFLQLVFAAIVSILMALPPLAFAKDTITLIAVGNNRVVLELNGERLVLTRENPSSQGVELIRSNGTEVVISHIGKQLSLDTENNSALIYGQRTTPEETETGNNSAILWADSNGFFFAEGDINGRSVKFLVDTGADIVTLSSVHADQLGINYQSGKDGLASTASGIAPLKILYLEKLTVAGITQYDVQISVVEGRFPQVPLLGGTFLNHLNMNRVGNKMELTQP